MVFRNFYFIVLVSVFFFVGVSVASTVEPEAVLEESFQAKGEEEANKGEVLTEENADVSVPEQEEIVAATEATEEEEKNDGKEQFYEKYICNHLQLGTRLTHRVLTNDDSGHKGGWYGSGTFLGTIYGLEMKQNYVPLQVYARYFVNEYFAVELGYDQLKVKTLTPDRHGTDGDVSLRGVTLGCMGFYRNESKFTPYAGLGLEFLSSDFSAAKHWATGYGGMRKREMVIDDVHAIFVSFGVMWAFYDKWNVDLSAKYMGNADTDVVFNGYTYGILDTVQAGHFPLDNWSFYLGVSYNF